MRASLPSLLCALAEDRVVDFPSIRPHQRHPWHGLLVHLAALAMHKAGRWKPWTTKLEWRSALLALTPDDPTGFSWNLVGPAHKPAFLQVPLRDELPSDWKNEVVAADDLDVLVTARNHSVKRSRATDADADDWLFALVSLQLQSGYSGATQYGISRMNMGSASRPGVGIAASGGIGRRWLDDTINLLSERDMIAREIGFAVSGGRSLLWAEPWCGTQSIAIESLDPLYVEICRKVRLFMIGGRLAARTQGTKVRRVASEQMRGVTGDAWTPIMESESKSLTLSASGWHYALMSELLFGDTYKLGAASRLDLWDRTSELELVAQSIVRSQGRTDGYHERRIPICAEVADMLAGPERATLAAIAGQRIAAIAAVRKSLWTALVVLFSNATSSASEPTKARAGLFARPFEAQEDRRFFQDLALEVASPADQRTGVRLRWQITLAERAETVLRDAFVAGPQSEQRRLKAQAGAIGALRRSLRSATPHLPGLAGLVEQREATPTDLSEEIPFND